jgi:HlyD family secretion protein
MNKKWMMFTIVAMVAILGLVSACSFGQQEATAEPAAVSTVQQPRVVSAEAFVVPVREASLSFEVGGRIIALEVKEGDQVKQGDVLAQLDDSTQQAALAEAKAGLAQSQAGLAEQEAGIAEAASRLAEAEADLAITKADPTQEEVAQLQASLAKAEAALAQMLTGPTPEELAEAEAGLRVARAELNKTLADARTEDLQASSAQVLKAEAAVREAQDDYDQVRYGDPDDVLVAGVALEKATLDYEAAKAEYDKLVNGATPEDIAISEAGVAQAQASLAKVQAGATDEEIAQAQADVAAAEADLAKLLAGATDEEIAAAEARVETARTQVEIARAGLEAQKAGVESSQAQVISAQVQVDQTVLTAPFDGTVSSLNDIHEGEFVQAGTEAITLGDTSTWQIETDDLTEIDVVDVQPGAKVTISVDALVGETFEGRVVRITPKAETKAGDQTYTVLIDITKGNASKLKWGMTTFVDIETDVTLAE